MVEDLRSVPLSLNMFLSELATLEYCGEGEIEWTAMDETEVVNRRYTIEPNCYNLAFTVTSSEGGSV